VQRPARLDELGGEEARVADTGRELEHAMPRLRTQSID